MNKEEKITISVNEEDVQNIINAYEKDIEYINQLEKENQKYKEVINKLIEYLQEKYDSSSLCGIVLNFNEFEDIKDLLKEVE